MLQTEISQGSRREIEVQTANLRKKIDELVIKIPADLTNAKIYEKECTALEGLIETKRTEITVPIGEQVKKINQSAKDLVAPITQCKEDIRNKQIAYAQKIEAERLRKEGEIMEIIRTVNAFTDEIDLELYSDTIKNDDPRIEIAVESRRQFFLEAERMRLFKIQQEEERKKLDKIKEAQGMEAARLAKKEANDRLNRQAFLDETNRMLEDNKKKGLEEAAASRAKIEKQAQEASAVKGLRKVAKFEVTHPQFVPSVYCTPDDTKIRQAIKDGIREIPGVRIWSEDKIS